MKKYFVISIIFLFTSVFSAYAEEIKIGQSCALTGPAAGLGIELKAGAEAYFNKINAEGGVHGRQLTLISYDDGYEPERCYENTDKLVYDDEVFVLFGYVGTPTTKAILPILENEKTPLVGPFTGAGFLRNTDINVFNIRGTYDQETGGLVKSFHQDKGYTKIACLYQNDAYGKVGLTGVIKGLKAEGLEILGSASYERNTEDVADAVAALQALEPEAVIMIGAYKPVAAFIKSAKQAGMKADFANISFVGTTKLIDALGEHGEGTYISQVVKSPADTSVPYVQEATTLLGRQPTYGELEGFLDAKVLVEGLKNAGPDLTRETFLNAMSNLSYDVGGETIVYSKDDHQGFDSIYFTKISNGVAVPVDKL